MSDLNLAFLAEDLDIDSETTVGPAVDTADTVTCVEAAVDCKNVHDRDCVLAITAHSLPEPSLKRESVGRECVWETIPVTSVNSNAPERKLSHEESQELELVAVKTLNVISSDKTRARNKRMKPKHCPAGNLNLDHSNDSYVLVDKSALQARHAKSVCSDTSPMNVCVENVDDKMSKLSAGLKNNSCAEVLSVETCHAVPKKSVKSCAKKRNVQLDRSRELEQVSGHGAKPLNLVTQNACAKKRKVQRDDSREQELETGLSVKSLNHVTQNTNANTTNRTRVRKKRKQKSMHSPTVMILNLDHRSDSCLLVEKSVLSAQDSDSSNLHCSDTYPIEEFVDKVAESMSELSPGNSCVEEVRIDAYNDTDVGFNLPQTAAQSVSVGQEDVDGLPNTNICPEKSDENKKTLNIDIFLDKDGPEKVESSKSNMAMHFPCINSTVQNTANSSIRRPMREHLLGTADEIVSTFQQQKKSNNRRRSQYAETAVSKPVEQQNVADGLSAVEQREGCRKTTTVQLQEQGADNTAEIITEMPNVDTAQRFPHSSADVLFSNQCILEDEFNDTDTFPVFTRQSSRRLRRTSILLYRKSLQDAEDIAMEEDCCALPLSASSENETAVTCIEMLSTNNYIFCDEFACQTTEPSPALTLPAAIMEKVDMQLDVQTIKLSSVSTSTELKPESDSHLTNITNTRPQRRCTANSQTSLNVPVSLPARTRKRKPSTTVEDIYLNRLWRSQMPKEKGIETIPESAILELNCRKVTKRVRVFKFDDAPSKTKLRQRRQKAVKNGWKPLTKKQHILLDKQLDAKLAEIDKCDSSQ